MSIKTIEAPAGATRFGNFDFLKNHIREYGMLLALIVITAFFQITTGSLLAPQNVTNLFLQNSFVIIMAIGMLLVIVTGHIDLSVGSVAGFIGGLGAVLMVNHDIWGLPAALICLVVGGMIGAAQGYLVAYLKVPSFIVTLAGMLIFRGLTLKVLGSTSVGPIPDSFQKLSKGYIYDLLPGYGMHLTTLLIGLLVAAVLLYTSQRKRAKQAQLGRVDEPFAIFAVRNFIIASAIVLITYQLASHRGLPVVLVIMAILVAVYGFMTTRMTLGRRIYAVGGNEKAAKLSGIKTERLVFLAFVNMGILAALAGLVYAARFGSATAKAGNALELDVIAACFIGGASAYGGVGKVIGAVVGAFIIGVMNMGMSILGIGIDDQQVIKGLVLLAAVCFDVYNRNKA